MNPSVQSADRSQPAAPRPNLMEQVAQVAADFDAGRHNPFESVDLSRFSPEARAKADHLQRERGFTPVQ